MKLSLWKILLWVAAIAVVAIIIVQPGVYKSKFTYQIETVANKCTFDVSPEQNIEVGKDSIVITMPIQTATPCYKVEGTVSNINNKIIVDLTTTQVGEICTECLGIVTAKVTLSNLDAGTYDLQVKTPDKSIITNVKIE